MLVLLLMFATCSKVQSQPSSPQGSQTDEFRISLESTETSIKVEWTLSDSNVIDFKVTLQEDTFIREIIYIDTDSPSQTDFVDLVPCRAYTVSIQPLDAGGNDIGNGKSKSISTRIATPPAVTELSSQNRAEGFTLTWQRPATGCEVTAYSITYSGVARWGPRTKHRGSSTIDREGANGATQVAVDGLLPYTDYAVIVTASTDKGVGELTFINTTTEEAAPSEPTNLEMFKSTASTVSMLWKDPSMLRGELKGYQVSCYDGAKLVLTETTQHPVHIVVGLSACTGYTVKVAASTAGGTGAPATLPVETKASPPPRVTGLAVRDGPPLSFSLTWKRAATACEITAYNITYSGVARRKPHSSEHKGSVNIGRGDAKDATSIAIDGLQPNTDYIVMVTASTEEGVGETESIDHFVTGAGDVPKKTAPQEPPDVASQLGSNKAPAHVADPSATLIVSVIVSVHVALCCSLLNRRHI